MPKATFFNLPENKKNRILNISKEEFSKKGYDKSSVSRIVKRSKIAKGSFYQYFKDKSDLYAYIVELALKTKLEYINRIIDKNVDEDVFSMWENIIIEELKYIRDNTLLAKISIDILKSKKKEFQSKYQLDHKKAILKIFENILKKGIKNGDIKENIDIEYTINFLYNSKLFIMEYYFEEKNSNNFNYFLSKIEKLSEIVFGGLKKREDD